MVVKFFANIISNLDINCIAIKLFIVFVFILARKLIESLIPITRTDADIERTIKEGDRWRNNMHYADWNSDQLDQQQMHNILEMFIVSKLPVHVLRGVEPNLRYGGGIKQYLDELSPSTDGRFIPRCPFINSTNNRDLHKCIHLASRKQIGDAIIRYEDQSII